MWQSTASSKINKLLNLDTSFGILILIPVNRIIVTRISQEKCLKHNFSYYSIILIYTIQYHLLLFLLFYFIFHNFTYTLVFCYKNIIQLLIFKC